VRLRELITGFGLLLLACRNKADERTKDQAAQEEARKANCPDLKTWADCDARMRAHAAASASAAAAKEAAEYEEAQRDIDKMWTDFDKKPKRDKPALFETIDATKVRILLVTSPAAAQRLTERNEAHYRVRMAPLVRPPTRATGPGYRTLVPSANLSECLVWGSMWIHENETASAMESLGFDVIKCDDGTSWDVKTRSKIRSAP
jgi:hypothetical protein